MSTAADLDRFLTELDTRRARLLKLAEPPGSNDADLLEEMNELSEQLIVADEELRVQQEELDSARRALVSLSAERDLLLQYSTRAYVITDPNGVVVQATRAVQQLIPQPATRRTRRPIATWFEVADRRTVRAMISRVSSTGEPQHAERVVVRAPLGQAIAVAVAVQSVTDGTDGRSLLRWELTPAESDARQLQVVPDPDPPLGTEWLRRLIIELGATWSELGGCHTTEEMRAAIVLAAVRLVPGAEHVGLVLLGPKGAAHPGAWSSEVALRTDSAQLAAGTGPVVEALAGDGLVVVDDLRDQDLLGEVDEDRGWPASALVVPLRWGERHLGALTMYADAPNAFGEEADLVADVLARQVSVALARDGEIASLRLGMSTRQLIGAAVGILVERHKITPEAAFGQLVRRSQHINVKLREIARIVVATGQDPAKITPP